MSERQKDMATYTQVATILQKALGQEEGLLVLEYIESRIPPDVARSSDVSKSEAALRLEIEKVRADLSRDIQKVRADLSRDIQKVRADLTMEIEKVRAEIEQVRADLSRDIQKVRADLTIEIERSKAAQTRWAFLFWISQMAVLVGILFRLLS